MPNAKILLGAVFFLVLSVPAHSVSPTENAYGIIVKFRTSAKAGFSKRDQLHQSLNTSLVYRPKRSPYDFVMPKGSDLQRDYQKLVQLCAQYQSASNVAECEINYNLVARADEPKPLNTIASTEACGLTPSYGTPLLRDGSLSPFWAQEAVGSDLAAFPKSASRMGFGTKVALVDRDYRTADSKKVVAPVVASAPGTEPHGALVLSLLTAATPYTLQAPIELTQLYEVHSTIDFQKVAESMEEKAAPAVVQIGVGLGANSNSAQDALKRMAAKATLVAAAGNEWPSRLDRNDREFPGILVGSVTPEGYPSATSSAGTGVAVSAPSDRYLQSTLDGKTAKTFGGTSGAAAMVASAIAAAKLLVPSLSTSEIKTLLQKTAFLSPNGLAANQENGSGSLNAVKFLAVADRIRAQGLEGKLRERALSAAPDTKLYRFEKESKAELERAAPVLANAAASCEQRKNAFNQTRRAFFLDPNGPAREKVVKMLHEQGLKTNARFIENLDRATLLVKLAEDVDSSDPLIRVSAARVAGYLGVDGLDLVMKFAESTVRSPASGEGVPSTGGSLKGISASMDAETQKILINRLQNHRNSDVKAFAEAISDTSKP